MKWREDGFHILWENQSKEEGGRREEGNGFGKSKRGRGKAFLPGFIWAFISQPYKLREVSFLEGHFPLEFTGGKFYFNFLKKLGFIICTLKHSTKSSFFRFSFLFY
ncbi:hypothetical protein SAY86_023518 [Trapa natans]|uniref:Uncharacterized protein n=1 Tax=Trapa natans TaxID=22666 RepID=A0AAN7RBK9_TRANT|nr:hypothetical protein SAY86_023518 [Trapa natans]